MPYDPRGTGLFPEPLPWNGDPEPEFEEWPPCEDDEMTEPNKEELVGMEIIRLMAGLLPSERVGALAFVHHTYCKDCGYPTPPEGYCCCQNDE